MIDDLYMLTSKHSQAGQEERMAICIVRLAVKGSLKIQVFVISKDYHNDLHVASCYYICYASPQLCSSIVQPPCMYSVHVRIPQILSVNTMNNVIHPAMLIGHTLVFLD